MIFALLLSCAIVTTPAQRQKYEAICIKEIAGANASAIMLQVHKERISACIVAKDKAAR